MPAPGQRVFDRFELLARLGGGGEAEVWQARDRDGRVVALKRHDLTGRSAAEVEGAWSALQRQHALVASVEHPGLLRPEEPVREGARLGLPMPLASDDARVLRGAPAARVLPVLRAVADAVAALHAAGIAHRDLKPGNVFLDVEGRALLGDFGAAAPLGESGADGRFSPYTAGAAQRRGAAASVDDDLHGFGALAYELLGGYPPRFPVAPPSGAAIPPVPPLVPAHPAPQPLCALVMSLLDEQEAGRPPDMAAVAAALRRIDAVAPAAPETVQARTVGTAGRAAVRAAATDGAAGGRRYGAFAAVLASLASLAAVFLWLPRMAPRPAPVVVADGAAAKTAADGAARAAADRAAREASAAAAAKAFQDSVMALEARGAGVWGGADFAAARAQGQAAARALATQDTLRAIDLFNGAKASLDKVAAAAPVALAERLRLGGEALAAGQPVAARQAFELAKLIAPEDARATDGLRRAAALGVILPRLAAAESALLGEQPLEAVTLYEQVLRQDPANADARGGLARARAALGSDAYARAIGDALAALREGRDRDARAALARARSLRPGGTEIAAVEAQSVAAGSRREVAATRASLEALEAAERWSEALAGYERQLASDPTLEFARAGKARVTPRAALAARLDALLADPSRLSAPEVRREAERSLARADAVRGAAPALRAQSARVRELLRVYDQPVAAVLESDGLTQVTLQRWGAVGAFTRKELQLKPGRYVAIGTRPGYRDVRREFTLSPDASPPVIVVRCTEAVS